jgi:FkbM family methyltransferase
MTIAAHVRRISPRFWFYCKFLRYKFYNGEHEIWKVRHFLTPDKVALDVGSSIGLYSCELARHAAKVIAFEANPTIAAFARRVSPGNVEVLNVALSSSQGETALRIPVNRRNNTIDDLATIEPANSLHSDRTVTEKVVTKRLDDYGFANCGFIKIDTEGHEEAVLDGANRLIETQRPVMMIELDNRFNPGITHRVMERLAKLHYAAYRFSDGRLRAVVDKDPVHSDSGVNFIFVPDEAKPRVMSHFAVR